MRALALPPRNARRSRDRPAARRLGAGHHGHRRSHGARGAAGAGRRARHGRAARRRPARGRAARRRPGRAHRCGGAVPWSCIAGQVVQPGYVITPQNSWGTGVVTPGNPPTYIVPEQRRRHRDRHARLRHPHPDPSESRRRNDDHRRPQSGHDRDRADRHAADRSSSDRVEPATSCRRRRGPTSSRRATSRRR